MKITSLFSGIGGLELGLEWAGVGRTVCQVEREPFCQIVLKRWWPNAVQHDDVRTVGAHNLPRADVVCGGFPCQDLSYAGTGAGLNGERSGLWFEYARIIREMGPRFVVVENVAGLRTREKGRWFGDVLGTLASLGYDAEWHSFRASDVGPRHRRERVFIIGWRPVADSGSTGLDRCEEQDRKQESHSEEGAPGEHAERRPMAEWIVGQEAQPRLGDGPDGLPARVVRWPAGFGQEQETWEPRRWQEERDAWHKEKLTASGNAVAPEMAYVIGKRLLEIKRSLG